MKSFALTLTNLMFEDSKGCFDVLCFAQKKARHQKIYLDPPGMPKKCRQLKLNKLFELFLRMVVSRNCCRFLFARAFASTS